MNILTPRLTVDSREIVRGNRLRSHEQAERVWIRGVFRATPETPAQPGGFPGVIEKLEVLQQTKPGARTFITK